MLSYQWYQGTSGDTSHSVGSNWTYTTASLISNTRYWVRVTNAGGSVDSSTVTVTVQFTDPTLAAGSTPLKATHITELRARINALRARYGLAAYPYTNASICARHAIVITCSTPS